jgi:HD-GYP domain-containing protein (c-di-GMP phosphodiesterase class II)
VGFVRVKKGEIKVGERLPWSVFSEAGTLLLHKGVVMETQHQLEMLVELGFHPDDDAPDRLNILLKKEIGNPFDYIEELRTHFKNLLRNLTLPTNDGPMRLNYSAALLIKLCKEFSDVMLGAVHRLDDKPYSITHSMHTAILSSLICHRLELDEEHHRRIVCAALTANLGMLDLQDSLENHSGPLNEEQREKVHKHPLESVNLLEMNVTTDEQWLQIVRQHHENLDGSGYPDGIQGDAVTQGARIIAIADRYSAMVFKHKYKKGLLAGQVLKQLYQDKGTKLDQELCLLFIHILGVYPPGSFVKLKNGETAIVTYHSSKRDEHWPHVSSFKGKDGKFYISPLRHDTNRPEYAILAMVEEEQTPFSDAVIWGFASL